MSNREELTRQAEKCLRQGRMDEAIAQYQELAHLEPVDWGLVKLLADLLERSGQREGAARQFARWADHLFAEGFHSKAAALYKKVLKLEAFDEHALWQLGEVSVALKLRADARVAYQRVLEMRQRRGDAAGAALARERLAGLDAAPSSALPPAPQAPLVPAPAPKAAPPSDSPAVAAPLAVFTSPVAPPPSPAAPPAAPAPPLPPPETPTARLARLRRDAEEADALGAPDADRKWLTVLDAEPADVAVRLRLVQSAMERGDLDAASQLAVSLDAAETPALIALIDLAHRQGRPDAVDRLVAGRIQAGAPAHSVLTAVDLLAARDSGVARAALLAAVNAWTAAGQPGYAAGALEQAAARGLLTTALYLQWVDICVDAGLPALSTAQAALSRVYLAEGRLAEARAVAEDVFVREGGTEPSRMLLLDVLDHEGVAEPHRVLVDLLTPPSERVADDGIEDLEATPEPTGHPSESDASSLMAVDQAAQPIDASAGPMFDWADLLGRDVAALQAAARPQPSESVQSPHEQASGLDDEAVELIEAVDAVLIDIEGSLPASEDEEDSGPVFESVLDMEPDALDAEQVSSLDSPSQAVTTVEEIQPDALYEPEERVAAAEPPRGFFADPPPPRIGDLRGQPFFAEDAPLQPSFSMPSSWLSESPAPLSADAPRRRAPGDDFFFDDDATPPRWAAPVRAMTPEAPLAVPAVAGQDSSAAEPFAPAVDEPAAPAIEVSPSFDHPVAEPDVEVLPHVPRAGDTDEPSLVSVEEEVDLTQLLEELKQWDPALPEMKRATPPAAEAGVSTDDGEAQDALPEPLPVTRRDGRAELDAAFADLQRHTDDRTVAEQQLAAGRVFLAAGLASEAARAFERASAEPRARFEAALSLGDLHKSRGQLLEAVGWYEQAAMAPVPDAAVKRPVLYDLAESLEALGETDRALGVLLDLLSQVEDYRDARARLDRLLRVDAGG
jgi:tetratricopeptide (TPR) repeat protein